jgi:hypothetical protein
MGQMQCIEHHKTNQSWVNCDGFNTVPVSLQWRLQRYFFITLHLLQKRGSYNAACLLGCG